ncbi:TPA: HAD family hydrolase [Vibrio vulnificus]|uniref:HAD family hydrolase n=1 Tax=Vibrio vulnificus TaxID=672 RepID=UPI000928ED74|nr:HAD family hydrolase [Vibrio vulnificus]EHH0748473.1 HAD family hydrolase [Vibrio vulnificus]EHT4940397.1 HAD family hydrolase [Vibrio vulnificus]OJI25461.1 haloacid dehalogenase-like hydrolase [Vibrio vulnificus]OJI49167.1 haloacid dehalogenase-like hydrolase [Vibrio vulnificus]POB06007.1 hypothetical protein CRN33_13780 [Vibrio vulnificus]
MNLSAWNAMSPISQRIKSTVDSWTDPSSDSFIPPEQRVAVFDLDGTLWCQKPILREWAFNIEQKISIHRFMSSLRMKWVLCSSSLCLPTGQKRCYESEVKRWLYSKNHHVYGVPNYRVVFLPMKQLIACLQSHQFDCYIVTGSSQQFVAACSYELFGISKERVISAGTGGEISLIKKWLFLGQTKMQLIEKKLTTPPVLAFGNSIHDIPLLNWVAECSPNTLSLFIHNDNRSCFAFLASQLSNKLYRFLLSDSAYQLSTKEDWNVLFDWES